MKPIGKRVLVREDEVKQTTSGGIILAPMAKQEMISQGEVIAIPDPGLVGKDVKVPVDKGDKILYNRNVAVPVTDINGEQLYTIEFDRILVKF